MDEYSKQIIQSIAYILAKTTSYNLKIIDTSQEINKTNNKNYNNQVTIEDITYTFEIILDNIYSVYKIQMSTLLCAIIYFDKIIKKNIKVNIQLSTYREYFLGCLLLAVKFNEESKMSIKIYGCSKKMSTCVKSIEFEILCLLDYKCFINEYEYDQYFANILKFKSLYNSILYQENTKKYKNYYSYNNIINQCGLLNSKLVFPIKNIYNSCKYSFNDCDNYVSNYYLNTYFCNSIYLNSYNSCNTNINNEKCYN